MYLNLFFSFSVRNYTRLEDIRDDLLSEVVKGALVDTYVAAARKDIFDHESLAVHKVNNEYSTLLYYAIFILA